jgi:hypothetical protein
MRVSTPSRSRAGISMLGLCLLASFGPASSVSAGANESGTLEKAIVASGRVALDLDLQQIREANAVAGRKATSRLLFDAEKDSFMTYIVFNGELRGPQPGSMRLLPREPMAGLPTSLNGSREQLVVENTAWGGKFDMVVRDGASGFLFFNVEGHTFAYEPGARTLTAKGGRLLISEEFARALGRPSAAGSVAGELTIEATLRPIEVSQVVDGEVREASLPALGGVPGPDVIVGDLSGLQQFGTTGTQVGLAVGTDSCNAGVVPLNWFATPSNDHPVIPQGLYRMSGGPSNDRTFEQIGQSSVKHAFTALQQNLCGFGCSNSGTGTLLGAGCSDPYTASLNAGPNLGSKAWINPFTGAYPRGDSPTPPNNHSAHTHPAGAALHRILTEMADLNTTLNPGATYFTEAQYVTPHEYAWCQAHAGECNMYNNVSYRRYTVSGTTSFSFSAAAPTVRMQPAITAWPGATIVQVEPQPGVDGVAYIAYKVTNPSAGVWHYEYALYNQNLDRAIQAFGIPKPAGVTLSNVGFHMPPQHPGWPADGTVGSAGYSSTPWAQSEADGVVTWGTQTVAQNANANAIRWGTMYNIRFDSNQPPAPATAIVTFFKTRARMRVGIQAPTPTP